MSNHVTEWLNAYFDGELTGKRLFQVEEHLAGCETCQAELESLEKLSGLLQATPTPEFTPLERLAAQVSLRIPHRQVLISRKQVFDVGWWMIPVGLLASWVFISTAFALGDVLSAASTFGLLSGISNWLGSDASHSVYLSTTIGQLGLLNSNSLNWAEATERFTRMSLPPMILQASIALLYLSWLAIWWTHRRHPENVQLSES
jgi:predicted anti-sigma-YlaC factor YlaD